MPMQPRTPPCKGGKEAIRPVAGRSTTHLQLTLGNMHQQGVRSSNTPMPLAEGSPVGFEPSCTLHLPDTTTRELPSISRHGSCYSQAPADSSLQLAACTP